MNERPKVTHRESLAKTRKFHIERINLTFSNGQRVEYERLRSKGNGAVLIIPLLDDNTLLLVREYAAGLERYEVGFPKGLIENGETPEAAADREIKEEVGYGSRNLQVLKVLSVAPGYADFQTHVVLAQDLYEERLPGDEPEPIEVLSCALNDADSLLQRADFVEARSIAGLYLLQQYMASTQ